MKKLIILLAIFLPFGAIAQRVLFNKNVYKPNEAIKCTLLKNVTGVSNSVVKQSQGAQNAGSFNVGSATEPGYYRIDFSFSATDVETYFVMVLPSGVEGDGFTTPIKNAPVADVKYSKFTNMMIKYIKDGKDYTPILNKALSEYIGKHPIDGPLAVIACIGVPLSGGNPVFAITCQQTAPENAKDLTVAFLNACNEQMKKENYLTQAEFDFFKGNIKNLDFVVSFASASNFYERMKAIMSLSDEDTTKNLVLGSDYAEQFYKKYQFVLKFK